MQRWMLPLVVAASLMGGVSLQSAMAATATAPAETAKKDKAHFATVVVNKKEVIRLADTPNMTAQQRAELVRKRLKLAMAAKLVKGVKEGEITVVDIKGQPTVHFKNHPLIAVMPQDAKLNAKDKKALADRWANDLKVAVRDTTIIKGKEGEMIVVRTGVMDLPRTATMGGGGGGKPKHTPKQQPKQHPK
jgi:hypothetical protein